MRVTKGCPICTGDVWGTAETGYYCKRCNLLFRKRHIVFRHAREEIRETIRKHFSNIEPVRPHERARPAMHDSLPPEERFLDRFSERMADTVEEIRRAKENLSEAVGRLPAETPPTKKTIKETERKRVKKTPKESTKERRGSGKKSAQITVKKKVPAKKRAAKKKPAKKKAVKRKATTPHPTKRASARKKKGL